jgi:hypothetical protein
MFNLKIHHILNVPGDHHSLRKAKLCLIDLVNIVKKYVMCLDGYI